MKVYLAARFSRIMEMRTYRYQLEKIGIQATSRWVNEDPQAGFNRYDSFETYAQHDLDDVLAADLLIFFSEPEGVSTSGGRHVEFGIALAAGIPIYVVGEHENVFHSLPSVRHWSSWAQLIKALRTKVEVHA